ncbi:hypothetical protein TanjilG_04757 [Lupinus angustifolius]|uniref:50S ribosomal protein L21, chloroplastic n=1 Tax=Lupinus angustifolius TaxID=3871 RepID=A0A4P1RKW0_LUPAN|nr:PREDICTED: 50S ribosomal protein L21, chloroplastic-like [Lupinus angustifolius]OIW12593.1 hypothetical protein TanjilG_04757 [Lupinus angustifolius]
MASATCSLSTLCTSFSTHCAITHIPKTPSSSSNLTFLSPSRFPSLSHNLSFSLSPLPKHSYSAVSVANSSELQISQTVEASPVQVPTWEKGLFAVVMIGGRQYIVHPGRWLVVQRLKGAKAKDKIALHKVLLVGTDTTTYIGKPIVTNAVVYATVEEQGLDDKVIVFKYKRKKHYKRTIGHRQPNTRIRINSIMGYENYPKVTLEDLKKDKDE